MEYTNITFRSPFDGEITQGIKYIEETDLLFQVKEILSFHQVENAVIMYPYNCCYPL